MNYYNPGYITTIAVGLVIVKLGQEFSWIAIPLAALSWFVIDKYQNELNPAKKDKLLAISIVLVLLIVIMCVFLIKYLLNK
ncbi:MAG: hypothetical protein ACRDD8_02910 [Bacteroidales bacterium]